MTISPPSSLGVPHSSWRPHQYETYLSICNSPYSHIFVEAPTGTGKTSIATALGHDTKIMALMSTLGLLDQYHREYNWTIIKGRQEYPCADIDKIYQWKAAGVPPPTAFDCHHSSMSDCEFSDYCPYLTARNVAMASQRLAMTYKYAAVAQWPKQRSGILVCDEGHSAAEEILSCTEFSITDWHIRHYNIPSPITYFSWRVQEMMDATLKQRVMDYLAQVYRHTRQYVTYADQGPQQAQGYRFHLRVGHMMQDLEYHDAWFLDVSSDVFRIRPLDARPVAHLLFDNKSKCIYMSATIGDPAPLAQEMGIDEYDYISTPHLVPKHLRPIHSIFTPRMTKRNRDASPGLYRAQAAAIAHFIRDEIPHSWRGLILTTSYFKIQKLRDFLLRDATLAHRIWQPPAKAKELSDRIQSFLQDPSPGIIAIDTIQGWGHGLDLRGDLGRFVIVAGVPHYNPSDPFDMARMKRPGGMRYARWTAYNAVVQACGRVTRGDRVNGEYQLNVAALADGSAVTPSAIRYFPNWFKEAMI